MTHPNGLTANDIQAFSQSGIREETLQQAGIYRVESRHGGDIVGRNGSGDYAGIVFPYYWPGDMHAHDERLRRDHPDLEQQADGSISPKNKYLSAPGRGNRLYFGPGTDSRWIIDPTMRIVMVEGEKKCLALWQISWFGLSETADRPRFMPVAIAGVWNWRGTIGKTVDANGERRDVKGTIADIDKIVWTGRRVTILFDVNVRTNESVRIARTQLRSKLASLGAKVDLFEWPEPPPKQVNGIDDLLGLWGSDRVVELLNTTISKIDETIDTYIDFAPAFLQIDDPPLQYLIPELIPAQVIALFHGDPRTRKSWAALDIAIAAATGTSAFHMSRFTAPIPVPVLYSSQEDSARAVRLRTKVMLQGRHIDTFPSTLAFSVHKGISLESPEWIARLTHDIQDHGFKLVIFDPIRRYSVNVDKGPAEVRLITANLRKLIMDTGCTVLIVHHDVKPPSTDKDVRRRGHKASGGDWFAASECPIAFEQATPNTSLVYPEDYKFSSDPDSFLFHIDSDSPQSPTWARLIGETTTGEDAADLQGHDKILSYLSDHAAGSGNAIAKSCKMRRDTVTDLLLQLQKLGSVDSIQKGRRTSWFLAK